MFPESPTTDKPLNPYQYYGNWPWGLNYINVMPANRLAANGLNANFNQYGSNFGYSHYFNPYYAQWTTYPYSNWLNAGHTSYPQTTTWQPYYPSWTNQWNLATPHYAWPTMNYFRNQIQYPSYNWPSPVHWGVQQTYSYKPGAQQGVNDRNAQPEKKETSVLKNTSSEVIEAFHVPSVVARKTVSDIPRSKDYSISIKKSDTSTLEVKSEDWIPFLVKISDSNIRQIAPSRSFGPSVVYNTESEPNGASSSFR
ncbi:hypothetical protein GE061_010630 [Apolygus lucorum]|uniref:Uncharacterized protein n=1 Tax=Apolygus lucorum TaxID=248454 RepID=A0A6A4K024_APOLU|nr:hypothetical protein GE061_010630 [Apolygus lucorum]